MVEPVRHLMWLVWPSKSTGELLCSRSTPRSPEHYPGDTEQLWWKTGVVRCLVCEGAWREYRNRDLERRARIAVAKLRELEKESRP